ADGDLLGRIADALHRGVSLGHRRLSYEVRPTVEAEVHVAVDQARRERPAGPLDHRSLSRILRRPGMRAGPCDPPLARKKALSSTHGSTVEEGDVREVGAHQDEGASAVPPRPATCRTGDRRGEYAASRPSNNAATRPPGSAGAHR